MVDYERLATYVSVLAAAVAGLARIATVIWRESRFGNRRRTKRKPVKRDPSGG